MPTKPLKSFTYTERGFVACRATPKMEKGEVVERLVPFFSTFSLSETACRHKAAAEHMCKPNGLHSRGVRIVPITATFSFDGNKEMTKPPSNQSQFSDLIATLK